MKIEVVREQVRTRERATQTERGGVADGDMLIYELQGFSLTILSFTETEKERQKERKTEAESKRGRRNDAKLEKTEREAVGWEHGKENEVQWSNAGDTVMQFHTALPRVCASSGHVLKYRLGTCLQQVVSLLTDSTELRQNITSPSSIFFGIPVTCRPVISNLQKCHSLPNISITNSSTNNIFISHCVSQFHYQILTTLRLVRNCLQQFQMNQERLFSN